MILVIQAEGYCNFLPAIIQQHIIGYHTFLFPDFLTKRCRSFEISDNLVSIEKEILNSSPA
ncbi:hypothetical protein ABIE50_001207 [Chitinophaga sp. OAE865]